MVGKIITLEIAVEPFGLRAADVARPPPRVGVARRAPQHRGLLPPLSPPYPVLPLSLVPIRPNLPLVRMILLVPLHALHWSRGGVGVGTGPGGPLGERRKGVGLEKTMARKGDRGTSALPRVACRRARGRVVSGGPRGAPPRRIYNLNLDKIRS